MAAPGDKEYDPATHTADVGPGQTLFHFVRVWSRHWDSVGDAVDRERGRDVQVTEAVFACASASPGNANASRAGVTINAIAAELGLDQSGASRMVEQAVRHGYLQKTSPAPGGGDRRARLVQATPEGLALVTQAHAWQEAVFADLTRDWAAADVATFTTLMQRLARAHSAAAYEHE